MARRAAWILAALLVLALFAAGSASEGGRQRGTGRTGRKQVPANAGTGGSGAHTGTRGTGRNGGTQGGTGRTTGGKGGRKGGNRNGGGADFAATLATVGGTDLLAPGQVRVLKPEFLRGDPTKNAAFKMTLLAAGGMSQVFRGTAIPGPGEFVVKVQRPQDPVEFDLAEYEIAVMEAVNGAPFMVRYLGSIVDKQAQVVHTFMNLAGRGTLEDYVNSAFGGSLPIFSKAARRIAAQMVASVAVLHSRGFLHRDLKAQQFLVGRDGHLRLADFNTAIRNRPEAVHKDVLDRVQRLVIGNSVIASHSGLGKQVGFKVADGIKSNILLENPSYRAPEVMLIEAVQDIRSNDLTRIFADMLRAERRRKFNKLARSRNPFKGKPVYDNVALDQPEIDAVKKQFLPIAQQYSTEWRKTLSGPLKPKLTYGAPSDWFTLGMTLYDVFSGFLCQSRLSGPWPNKRAIASMGYDPDFSKPMNLRQWRQEVADLNGYSPDDEGIADLADLLTKMLHVDAASRLSDPLRILAHPFFAKMGITVDSAIADGIAAAANDQRENQGITVVPPRPLKLGDSAPLPPQQMLSSFQETLQDDLEDTVIQQIDAKATGPLAELLLEGDTRPRKDKEPEEERKYTVEPEVEELAPELYNLLQMFIKDDAGADGGSEPSGDEEEGGPGDDEPGDNGNGRPGSSGSGTGRNRANAGPSRGGSRVNIGSSRTGGRGTGGRGGADDDEPVKVTNDGDEWQAPDLFGSDQ